MEKRLCDFVAIESSNLYFFVKLFSMTLIVDCAYSSEAAMAHYV